MKKALANLGLRKKLLLLSLVPLMALLYLGATGIVRQVGLLNDMRTLQAASQFAVTASALVHETQKERGATGVYMGSGGKSFGAEMLAQRAVADKRIAAIQDFLKNFDSTKFGGDFQTDLKTAQDKLATIAAHRKATNEMAITPAKGIGFYSDLDALYLKAISHMSHRGGTAEMSSMLAAYTNFLQGKEKTGVERATMATVFGADKFDKAAFQKFGAAVNTQDTYLRVFLSLANEEQQSVYKDKIKGTVVTEAQRMRDIAFEKADTGGFGVDSAYWYQTMTAKINLLKEVEDQLSSDLDAKANTAMLGARNGLIVNVILVIVSLCVTLIFALWISHMISSALTKAVDVARNLALGILSERVNSEARDETGQLLNAMDEMTSYLKEMAGVADKFGSGDLTVNVEPKSA
jgi:methyl-accepting chemotaxis protein